MSIFKTNLKNPRVSRRLAKLQLRAGRLDRRDVEMDLFLLLEEIAKIEHLQDQELIDRLRVKYGWEH